MQCAIDAKPRPKLISQSKCSKSPYLHTNFQNPLRVTLTNPLAGGRLLLNAPSTRPLLTACAQRQNLPPCSDEITFLYLTVIAMLHFVSIYVVSQTSSSIITDYQVYAPPQSSSQLTFNFNLLL